MFHLASVLFLFLPSCRCTSASISTSVRGYSFEAQQLNTFAIQHRPQKRNITLGDRQECTRRRGGHRRISTNLTKPWNQLVKQANKPANQQLIQSFYLLSNRPKTETISFRLTYVSMCVCVYTHRHICSSHSLGYRSRKCSDTDTKFLFPQRKEQKQKVSFGLVAVVIIVCYSRDCK